MNRKSYIRTLSSYAIASSAIFCGIGSVLAQDAVVAPVQTDQQILPTPDYRGDLCSRSTITGDWGGARQSLANRGVTVDAALTQVVQSVFSGGIDTGSEYLGRADTTLNLDTAKLGLWPGGLLTLKGEGNFGDPLTNKTGALITADSNEVFPEADSSYLIPQLSFTQFFSPRIGISIGKLATINDKGGDLNEFAHGKGDEQFLNLVFNINPVSALTVPYSTLGANVIMLPSDDLVVVASVFDPHGKPNSAGLEELFDNGETWGLEGRYTTKFFSMLGHQLVGGTYSSSDYFDLDQSAANLIIPGLPVEQADHSWSAYWNADQYIYQPNPEADRGVGLFARYGRSDGQANPIENFASAGIGGKGMIDGRENDRFGVGYFYLWTADNRVTSRLNLEDTQGFELYYEFALTPAIQLSPDLQWIDPAQQQVDSSWIAALRLHTVF